MSFLNSIINSINNPGASHSLSQPPANPSPAPRLPTQPKSTIHHNPTGVKRKSNEYTTGAQPEKFARQEPPQARAPPQQPRPPAAPPSGTTRPLGLSSTTQTSSTRPPAPSSKPPPLAAAQPSKPAAPPKKGSYKDILARAAANQKAQANFGKVTHKPVDKTSRRDRQRREEAEAVAAAKKHAHAARRAGGPSGGISKPGAAGRVHGGPKSAVPPSHKAAEREKPKRQPLDLGYKGTMRAGPVAGAAAKGRSGAAAGGGRQYGGNRGPYTYSATPSPSASGSFDEDEEDGEDDENSDGGGGFDELMEEEEASLRAARKEDAEALREENEHRREKEERRRRLAALAAKRR